MPVCAAVCDFFTDGAAVCTLHQHAGGCNTREESATRFENNIYINKIDGERDIQ